MGRDFNVSDDIYGGVTMNIGQGIRIRLHPGKKLDD